MYGGIPPPFRTLPLRVLNLREDFTYVVFEGFYGSQIHAVVLWVMTPCGLIGWYASTLLYLI